MTYLELIDDYGNPILFKVDAINTLRCGGKEGGSVINEVEGVKEDFITVSRMLALCGRVLKTSDLLTPVEG